MSLIIDTYYKTFCPNNYKGKLGNTNKCIGLTIFGCYKTAKWKRIRFFFS